MGKSLDKIDSELPLEWMNPILSDPRDELYKKLIKNGMRDFIEKNYLSTQDRGDAYDGAFIGMHIHEHLSQGADENFAMEEMHTLFCYFDQNITGPFYTTLKETLRRNDRKEIFDKGIDYIIYNSRN